MAFLEEYTLLCELGKGGFATVYKVRHNELGYIRAVRVLNDTIQNKSDKTYQNFLRECKLLLVLGNGNHRGIVHIYKPDFLANKAVVEMDYVDGKDLLHYLADNKYFLLTDEVIRMVEEMSSALAYCHEDIYKFRMDRDADGLVPDPMDGSKLLIDEATRQKLIDKYKVIHNDIHSRNIMRRENGDFVLLDFGLAIEGDEVGVSSSRRNAGALEYISPEKLDDSSVLTTQSDIYSFGVVMYEYLTGRVPFKMEKNSYTAQTKLLEKVMGQSVPSIFEMRKESYEAKFPNKFYTKDYPDWLEAVILKCLEKDPDNRFRNGKELYDFVHYHIEEDRQSAGVNKELEKERDTLKNENEKLIKHVAEIEIKNKELEKERDILKSENEKLIKQVAEIKNNEPDDSIKTLNEELPSSNDSEQKQENEPDENNNGVNHTDGKKKRNLLWIGLGIGVAVVALVLAVIFLWSSEEWIDLGLPSGTLWKNKNEKLFYNYDDAVSTFGSELPTKEQFEELRSSCKWSWTGTGFTVVGSNGNSIFLPAEGYRSCDGFVSDEDSLGRYWSSTSSGSNNSWNLIFDSGALSMDVNLRCNGRSVRLVRATNDTLSWHDWVDLGLPSGTLWKNTNEKLFYNYDDAVCTFGSELPTKEQFEELRSSCKWSWTGTGFTVVGSNGNSIFLPAEGYRSCEGIVSDVDFLGRYWSSTSSDSLSAWNLILDSKIVSMCGNSRCNGRSVRLVRAKNGTLNGHNWVDLDLPSGTKWATCNIGATNPEDYGNYYAWGEITTKDSYNWITYRYCNGSDSTLLTKYCNNTEYGNDAFTDNLTTLKASDDAATANWGSAWRMPTKEEFEELNTNCTVTWTTQNGVHGRLFTGSNGNSIFLPVAGRRFHRSLVSAGSYGGFWSSSLYSYNPGYAWSLGFDSDYYYMSGYDRGYGLSVRPVCVSAQN